MVFVVMITEAFGRGSHYLTLKFIRIQPCVKHAISGKLLVILLVLVVVLLVHQFTAMIAHQIAILYV
jgi:hypothetical protein